MTLNTKFKKILNAATLKREGNYNFPFIHQKNKLQKKSD